MCDRAGVRRQLVDDWRCKCQQLSPMTTVVVRQEGGMECATVPSVVRSSRSERATRIVQLVDD